MDDLGKRVKYVREAMGWSQSETARRLGVTPQSVSSWESDKSRKLPGRDSLTTLSLVSGCPIDWLLYGGPLPEQDQNGNFVPLRVKGGIPIMDMAAAARDVLADEHKSSNRINAAFPTGPRAVAVVLRTSECEPAWPAGSVWIIDPDAEQAPGKLVLAACGAECRPVTGILSYQVTQAGKVMIVTPTNTVWPAARSDLEIVEIVGIVTEGIRKV